MELERQQRQQQHSLGLPIPAVAAAMQSQVLSDVLVMPLFSHQLGRLAQLPGAVPQDNFPAAPVAPGISQPHPSDDVDRLSALPGDVLGKIFSSLKRLRTPLDVVDDNAQALLQTCKTIHNTAACLEQISTFVLYLDERKHGSMSAQLRAVPPGAHCSRIKIAGSKDWEVHRIGQRFMTKEEAESIFSCRCSFEPDTINALAYHATHSSPQRLHLHSITDLIIGRSCTIPAEERDCRGEPPGSDELLMDCIAAAFPGLANLECYAGLDPYSRHFLTMEVSEFKHLRSLIIELDPCEAVLSTEDCAAIGNITSLRALTLRPHCLIEDIEPLLTLASSLASLCICTHDQCLEDLTPLSSMTGLTSLALTDKFDMSLDDPSGFLQVLHNCSNLQELMLEGLETYLSVQMPVSQRVELLNMIPTICSCPALKSLHVDTWTIPGSALDISAALASLQGVPRSLSFSLASLVLMCSEVGPCTLLLESLPPDLVVPSLRSLHCTRVQFGPQQLASLACHFPNVLVFKTKACEFSCFYDSALEALQGFPHLRFWQMAHPSMPRHHFGDAVDEAQRHSNKFLFQFEFVEWNRSNWLDWE